MCLADLMLCLFNALLWAVLCAPCLYATALRSDDHVFIVERKFAMVSGTIKAMLSGAYAKLQLARVRSSLLLSETRA